MHPTRMSSRLCTSLLILLPMSSLVPAQEQAPPPRPTGGEFPQHLNPTQKVPSGVILVKGAWSSASDATTPVPEGGEIAHGDYANPYFRLTYPLPQDWIKKYDGPPPSDSGYYVLAQLEPREAVNGAIRGSMIITAADLFFSPTRAESALQFVNFARQNLQADYKVERAPTQLTVADHPFVRFDYFSPVAGLHWYVLATEIRCHVVEFVFTSRDVRLLGQQVKELASMKLTGDATGGGEVPVCIKDYARPENIVAKVDPILTDRKFNPIPVRVIIDKQGDIKHIHFLSAFPDQAKAITDALHQWKLKPYMRDGRAMDVETGIMFGHAPESTPISARVTSSTAAAR
jgi:hypothetical protein